MRKLQFFLSAGAIKSPAILMRSGIGPRLELEALGFKCLVNLMGVGTNLIDHPMVFIAAKPVPGVTRVRAPRYPQSLEGRLQRNQLRIARLAVYLETHPCQVAGCKCGCHGIADGIY